MRVRKIKKRQKMKNENHRLSTTTIAERNIIASGQVQVCGGRQAFRENSNGSELVARTSNLKIKLKLHVGGTDIQTEPICLPPSAMGIRKIQSNGTYPAVFRGRYDD